MSYLYLSHNLVLSWSVMSTAIKRVGRVVSQCVEDGLRVVAQGAALLREEFYCRAVAFIYRAADGEVAQVPRARARGLQRSGGQRR